jgi:hypothetical protein
LSRNYVDIKWLPGLLVERMKSVIYLLMFMVLMVYGPSVLKAEGEDYESGITAIHHQPIPSL